MLGLSGSAIPVGEHVGSDLLDARDTDPLSIVPRTATDRPVVRPPGRPLAAALGMVVGEREGEPLGMQVVWDVLPGGLQPALHVPKCAGDVKRREGGRASLKRLEDRWRCAAPLNQR